MPVIHRYCFGCGNNYDRPNKIKTHLQTCKCIDLSKLTITGDSNFVTYDGEQIDLRTDNIIRNRKPNNNIEYVERVIETPPEYMIQKIENINEEKEELLQKVNSLENINKEMLQKIKSLENIVAENKNIVKKNNEILQSYKVANKELKEENKILTGNNKILKENIKIMENNNDVLRRAHKQSEENNDALYSIIEREGIKVKNEIEEKVKLEQKEVNENKNLSEDDKLIINHILSKIIHASEDDARYLYKIKEKMKKQTRCLLFDEKEFLIGEKGEYDLNKLVEKIKSGKK